MTIYTPENKPKTISYIRDFVKNKLVASDWTQLQDVDLSEEKKLEWQKYRQELRDLTKKYTDADDLNTVIFPTKPE
jgi:hypothetical protein